MFECLNGWPKFAPPSYSGIRVRARDHSVSGTTTHAYDSLGMHTYIHAYIHTHTHSCIYTYTYIHACIYT
jgi:hypothetical protein